jgi:hypothetical protein
MVEAIRADAEADYFKRIPGLYGSLYLTNRENSLPCVKYFVMRRLLSTGLYSDAFQVSKSSTIPSGCESLVALETARLYWFLENYSEAFQALRRITKSSSIPTVVRLRVADVIAAAQVEIYSSLQLGILSKEAGSLRTCIPSQDAIVENITYLNQVIEDSKRSGDDETKSWAMLDRECVKIILDSTTNEHTALDIIEGQISRNGVPHAYRKLALVLAAKRASFSIALDLLMKGMSLGFKLYPDNLIVIKSAIDFLHLSKNLSLSRNESADYIFARTARDFVAKQFMLIGLPITVRIELASRTFFLKDIYELTSMKSQDEIAGLLGKVNPDDMEAKIAWPLLRRKFSDVERMPPGYEYFDFVVHLHVGGEQTIGLGVQVKSGKKTIDQNNIPGKEVFDAKGLKGYVAICVRPYTKNAKPRFEMLQDQGIVIFNWTGDRLVSELLCHQDILDNLASVGH